MPHADAVLAPAELSAANRKVLLRVFQHPLSHNLSWREVGALIEALGTVETAHNGDVVYALGAERQSFRPAHDKDLPTADVMALRHFLSRAGLAPESGGPEAGTDPAAPDDIAIVIDHAGARLYSLPPGAGSGPPQESHHLRHAIDRKQHDTDRDETFPADRRFFDAIATAAAGPGRIVVLGHGKGQSAEADHLLADLAAHHPAIRARVIRQIVADLPHLSVPQQLALARQALEAAPETV